VISLEVVDQQLDRKGVKDVVPDGAQLRHIELSQFMHFFLDLLTHLDDQVAHQIKRDVLWCTNNFDPMNLILIFQDGCRH